MIETCVIDNESRAVDEEYSIFREVMTMQLWINGLYKIIVLNYGMKYWAHHCSHCIWNPGKVGLLGGKNNGLSYYRREYFNAKRTEKITANTLSFERYGTEL